MTVQPACRRNKLSGMFSSTGLKAALVTVQSAVATGLPTHTPTEDDHNNKLEHVLILKEQQSLQLVVASSGSWQQ